VFLKRYAPASVTARHLEATHRFVAHLRSRGVPTPGFLPFEGGATALVDESGVWEISEAARGSDRYRDAHSWSPPASAAEARALGHMTARIALASADFEEPRQPPSSYQSRLDLFTHDPRPHLADWLEQRPGVAAFLVDTGRDLAADLELHSRFARALEPEADQLPLAWTHGDLHVSNAFWEGDHISDVIDFGLADRTVAVYDLAVAIERNAFLWLDIMAGHADAVRLDIAAALIDGYQQVRPLSHHERAALAAVMPVVQAEAALNWIEYQYALLHDVAAATWSYDVFFLAHTRWFDTTDGARFTRWLEKHLDCGPGPVGHHGPGHNSRPARLTDPAQAAANEPTHAPHPTHRSTT
jgi:Putative homoserine kinase type II (protein kinase fold)